MWILALNHHHVTNLQHYTCMNRGGRKGRYDPKKLKTLYGGQRPLKDVLFIKGIHLKDVELRRVIDSIAEITAKTKTPHHCIRGQVLLQILM